MRSLRSETRQLFHSALGHQSIGFMGSRIRIEALGGLLKQGRKSSIIFDYYFQAGTLHLWCKNNTQYLKLLLCSPLNKDQPVLNGELKGDIMHLCTSMDRKNEGGKCIRSEKEYDILGLRLQFVKDNSILLLIFVTVVTQQKFDSKSVTQLSSAQCYRLFY